jgi:hypothetical protein
VLASGFQEYSGGFDFAGTITKIIVEVGGRDINLAIGPLFDDVSINVLYNVVNTIITEHILSVEMWVSYGGSTETEVIDIVENIFEHNDVIDAPGDDMYFEPEFDEPDMEMSYETVEYEMEMDFEVDFEMDFEMPNIDIEDIEIATIEYEMEMEMEMELDMPDMEMPEPDIEPDMETEVGPKTETATEPEPETEEINDEPIEEIDEPAEEPAENVAEEPETEESTSEASEDEGSEEDMDKPKNKTEPKKEIKKQQKEKAAKKIVKKMGDKGKYDSANQTKTLIVMQVLGDTKTFFETQQALEDRLGFFTDIILPDTTISDNNIAAYLLFAGSDGLMNDMVESQWQK